MKIFNKTWSKVQALLDDGAMSADDILDLFMYSHGEAQQQEFLDMLIAEFGPAKDDDDDDDDDDDEDA